MLVIWEDELEQGRIIGRDSRKLTRWDSKKLDRGGGSRNREEKMELRAIKEEIINGGWLFVEDVKRGRLKFLD